MRVDLIKAKENDKLVKVLEGFENYQYHADDGYFKYAPDNQQLNYLVGCVVPDFPDQDYIRDRDLVVKVDNEQEAIQTFYKKRDYWLIPSERKFVKVIAVFKDLY